MRFECSASMHALLPTFLNSGRDGAVRLADIQNDLVYYGNARKRY